MNYVEYNFDPGVAAVSATMVILSLAVAWLIERWVGIRKVLGGPRPRSDWIPLPSASAAPRL